MIKDGTPVRGQYRVSSTERGTVPGSLFTVRGAWHRSHRVSTGSCRPPAYHRRGRSPFNRPTSDHADGATLGRQGRPRRPGPKEPGPAAASRQRSDSGEQIPTARGKRAPAAGCRVRHCAGIPLRFASRSAQCRTGLGAWLSFRREKVPGSAPIAFQQALAGRRRDIGVVAALSIDPRATTPMVRRWDARGGPEGRGRKNQDQRQRQRQRPGQRQRQRQRPGQRQRQRPRPRPCPRQRQRQGQGQGQNQHQRPEPQPHPNAMKVRELL